MGSRRLSPREVERQRMQYLGNQAAAAASSAHLADSRRVSSPDPLAVRTSAVAAVAGAVDVAMQRCPQCREPIVELAVQAPLDLDTVAGDVLVQVLPCLHEVELDRARRAVALREAAA